MAPQLPARGKVLVALGANCPGPWGTPRETIARALGKIEDAQYRRTRRLAALRDARRRQRAPAGLRECRRLLDTTLPPESLLRVLKQIEREAGRRGGRPWGPRTLDIDIVDYKGLVRHWRGGRGDFARAGARPLVLPHPLAHRRPFVLKPLLDIAPDWRHPALKLSAEALWRRADQAGPGRR